jgi:hypothetical protein
VKPPSMQLDEYYAASYTQFLSNLKLSDRHCKISNSLSLPLVAYPPPIPLEILSECILFEEFNQETLRFRAAHAVIASIELNEKVFYRDSIKTSTVHFKPAWSLLRTCQKIHRLCGILSQPLINYLIEIRFTYHDEILIERVLKFLSERFDINRKIANYLRLKRLFARHLQKIGGYLVCVDALHNRKIWRANDWYFVVIDNVCFLVIHKVGGLVHMFLAAR